MNLVLAFGMPGPLELGIILAIGILVFGLGKLPKVGSQLGSALRNFKQGLAGMDDPEPETKVKAKPAALAEKKAKETVAEVTEVTEATKLEEVEV